MTQIIIDGIIHFEELIESKNYFLQSELFCQNIFMEYSIIFKLAVIHIHKCIVF